MSQFDNFENALSSVLDFGFRVRNLARLIAVNALGRGLISPLTARRVRDDNTWVIYGWKGRFRDNAKYIFLHLQQAHPEIDCYFLTFHKPTLDELRQHDLPCLWGGDRRTWEILFSAGVWIVDHGMYRWESLLTEATEGALRVMLWHGVPLKRFYANNDFSGQWSLHVKENKTSLEEAEEWAREASFPNYDLVVSTSERIAPIMKSAFADLVTSEDVVVTGYPRNDHLTGVLNTPSKLTSLGTDAEVYQRLDALRRTKKIALYMPTYRDQGNNPLSDGALELDRLDAFCERHGIHFLLKLHPEKRQRNYQWNKDFQHITWISNDVDIYPILPKVDLLVSDYSSITFDFLLLDRPAILYAYDFDEYVTKNRKLHFDYEEIAPGPVAYSFDELLEAVLASLDSPEDYAEARDTARQVMMGGQNGSASETIFEAIIERLS